MKRSFICAVLIGIIITASGLAACKRQAAAPVNTGSSGGGVTVRLLTDATGIDDKSFNAAAWRGILEFYGDTWQNARQRGSAYDVVTAQTQDM
jgi:basic membrane protein A